MRDKQNISSNNRRIAKNTMALYVRMFITMGISLYTSRIVLQSLGVSDFGIYNVVGGVVSMISCLNGSFNSSTSRFITFELGKKNGNVQAVFSSAITIHTFMAVIMFLIAETIGLWFVLNKLTIPENRITAALIVYQISILTCMINITQVPYTATIIANERMGIYAYVSIFETIAKLIIVYLLFISKYDKLIVYSLLLFVLTTSIALFYRYYCMKNFKYTKFKLSRETSILKPMLSFSGWDMYGTISTVFSGQGINIIQNMYFGPIVNASVGVSNQVKNAVLGFANNFLLASRPQIVKYYADNDIKNMEQLSINSGKYAFLLLFLFACPIIIECEYIMNLWLIEVPTYAIVFCQLAFIENLISVMFRPCVFCIHSTGRVKWMSFVTGTLFYLMIPVAYILLNLGYSPIAPMVSSIIFMIITCCFYLYFIKCNIPTFSLKKYLLDVVCTCITIAGITIIFPLILHHIMDESFMRLILVTLASSIALAFIVYNYVISKSIKETLHRKLSTLFMHRKLL